MTAAHLKAWLAAQAGQAVVLDVREPWELQTASVRPDGFELIAIPLGELASRFGELPAQACVACLCHHGVRSQHAAAFLDRQGIAAVNLQGGIDAWSCELDPSVARY